MLAHPRFCGPVFISQWTRPHPTTPRCAHNCFSYHFISFFFVPPYYFTRAHVCHMACTCLCASPPLSSSHNVKRAVQHPTVAGDKATGRPGAASAATSLPSSPCRTPPHPAQRAQQQHRRPTQFSQQRMRRQCQLHPQQHMHGRRRTQRSARSIAASGACGYIKPRGRWMHA